MLRFRHLSVIADDHDKAVDDLSAVLGLEVAYADPAVHEFGMNSRTMPIGHRFIEVVSPREEQSAGARYIRERGVGGYLIGLQCSDHPAVMQHVVDLGMRIVLEDHTDVFHSIQVHPKDAGGFLLELDEHTDTVPGEPNGPWWDPVGDGTSWKAHQRTDVSIDVAAVEVNVDDPDWTASRVEAIIERESQLDDQARRVFTFDDGGVLRFVTGPGVKGFSGLDVMVHDRELVLDAARRRGLTVEGQDVAAAGLKLHIVETDGAA